MGLIYFLIKLYPFFGFSMTVVCVDIAIATRRKGHKKALAAAIIIGGLFFVTACLWIGFRGDKRSDEWFFKVNRVLTLPPLPKIL